MSLYREAGETRRRRRRLILLGVLAAALVVTAIVVIASSGGTSATDRAKAADGAVLQAQDGLELLATEYAQAVRGGRVVAPTEFAAAQADVQRASDALAGQRAELSARDPAAYRAAQAALAQVATVVAAKVAPAVLERRITAARTRVTALAR